MSVSRLANRYAKSLLDSGVENNCLNDIVSDTKYFLSVADNKDFNNLLRSPIISLEKKQNVFNAIFGKSTSPVFVDFLNLVLKKGREPFLKDIVLAFWDKYNERRGVSVVKITSAVELSSVQFDQIKEKLGHSSFVKNEVTFNTEIDPSIIGGFIIEIGDRLYDASISGKLKKIRSQIV